MPRRSAAALCIAAVLAWLVWLAWIDRQGRPVPVLPAKAAVLPCLSYAPFRREGHTPFDDTLVVSPAQIEEDLRILATATRCVRTYGVDHGIDAVPALAQRLGMRVVLGAWIGRDAAANARQVERVLALATAHRDTVAMVMIGNEVLLRRELDAAALAALLADARKRSPVPVAYADVWEFWLRHGAALRDHVDVVAIHVLPYWEDEPVHANHAVAHVRAAVERMRGVFTDKPVWLAESGWPAAGRQRGPAVPGAVQQASFVRGLLDAAAADQVAEASNAARALPAGIGPMNVIEAFDQPWKRSLEGAVGGHWGVFDAQGKRRVSLEGDVVPRPDARRALMLAAVGALVGALLGAVSNGLVVGLVSARSDALRGATSSARHGSSAAVDRLVSTVVVATAAAGLGAAASWQWQVLVESSVDARAWAIGLVWLALSLACGAHAALRAAVPSPRFDRPAAGVATAHESEREGRAHNPAAAWLHLAWLALTAVFALQLVFDARYRDVAWPLPAAAAACLLWWRIRGQRLSHGARHERALAWLLAASAPLILWHEGVANVQAWSAVFPCAATAVATWWPFDAARVSAHRVDGSDASLVTRASADTHASNASTAAGADHPAP